MEHENQALREEIVKLLQENKKLKNENEYLKEQNQSLDVENKELKEEKNKIGNAIAELIITTLKINDRFFRPFFFRTHN